MAIADTSKKRKIEKVLKSDQCYFDEENFIFRAIGIKSVARKERNGLFVTTRQFIKRKGRLYSFLVWLFSPVLASRASKRALNKLLNDNGVDKVILNIGSGPYYPEGRDDIINVDIFPYQEVDVISYGDGLPIGDNTIDLVICTALLEHVEYPNKVVAEIFRVLKDNGQFYCYVPFIVPYHDAPLDYYRWTKCGSEKMFRRFSSVTVGVGCGPTSGVLWPLLEWFALCLSFNNAIMHDVILILLMIVFWPIKLFDTLFERLPHAHVIASGFFITGKKKTIL